MGKSHPVELRSRVIAFVEAGHGHREAARHFFVSPKFVNDLVILKRETGTLAPRPQGNRVVGKLAPCNDWLRARLAVRRSGGQAVKGDLTLDEIVLEMASVHGLTVHRGSVGRWLHRLGLSHKKNAARQRAVAPRRGRAAAQLE